MVVPPVGGHGYLPPKPGQPGYRPPLGRPRPANNGVYSPPDQGPDQGYRPVYHPTYQNQNQPAREAPADYGGETIPAGGAEHPTLDRPVQQPTVIYQGPRSAPPGPPPSGPPPGYQHPAAPSGPPQHQAPPPQAPQAPPHSPAQQHSTAPAAHSSK